ncbi:MAG: tetratricopeptide repeat protein [Candidatus Omnitrophica bacterium]|nr:tetratricopeptide repeat protein [Candidatus Omnitrophota bacterium]
MKKKSYVVYRRNRVKSKSGGMFFALICLVAVFACSVRAQTQKDEPAVDLNNKRQMRNKTVPATTQPPVADKLNKDYSEMKVKYDMLTQQRMVQDQFLKDKAREAADIRQSLQPLNSELKKARSEAQTLRQENIEANKLLKLLQEDAAKKEKSYAADAGQTAKELDKIKKFAQKLKDYALKVQAKNKKYALEIKELKMQIADKEKTEKSLENKMRKNSLALTKDLETMRQDLEQRLRESGQREQQMQKQLADAGRQIENLRGMHGQIAVSLDEYEAKDKRLRQELEEKEKALLAGQDKIREAEQFYAKKYAEKEKKLREKMSQATAGAQQVQAKKTGYEFEFDKLIEQAQAKDQKIQAQEKVIQQQQEALALQSKKYDILLEENKNEVAQELIKLKKENEKLLAQHDKLINEKKQLLLKLVNYQKQTGAEAAAGLNQGSIEIAYEEVNYLKTEFDNLNAVLNKAYEELIVVKEQNSVLSKDSVDLLTRIVELKKQLEEKGQKLALTEKLMEGKEREYVAKLENNKKELNDQLKEFRDLAKELQKKNELTNRDKAAYLAQMDDYKNRLTVLQKEHEALKSDSNALAKQLREMYRKERAWQKKEVGNMKLLSRYSASIDELTEKVSKVKAENQQLTLLIKTMPEKLSELERQLNDTRMENAALHYNLGVFHTQRQEYTQAIEEFNNALQFNKNDASSHYNMGIIYSRYIIDEAKAISHFKHYLALSPNDKDAQRAKEYLLIWGTKGNKR